MPELEPDGRVSAAVIRLPGHAGARQWRETRQRLIQRRFLNSKQWLTFNTTAPFSVMARVSLQYGFICQSPFFSGGDIGNWPSMARLMILLCAGRVLFYLSTSFILEEGLSMQDSGQWSVHARRSRSSQVALVTGDNVVDRGGRQDFH